MQRTQATQFKAGTSRWIAAGIVSLLALIEPSPAKNLEPGISPRAILIGQSGSFSGKASGISREFRRGAHYAINEVNAQGGVHGRQIVMIYRDDQYDPAKTHQNTQEFLKKDKTFALFGYTGTANIEAAMPLISKASVPLIAPLSGARLLREPFNKLIFNVRASYYQEMAALVNYLIRFGRDAIAIVYQNDSFGEDALQGAIEALERHRLKPITTVALERNSTDTKEAARLLALSKPDGVLILTAYPAIPNLIRELRQREITAQIMTHSNSNAESLPTELRHGIGISQVVPYPWNPRIGLIRDYQSTIQRHQKSTSFSFASLEGYLAAKVLVKALEQAGPNPTRTGLIRNLESLPSIDLEGYRLKFSENDHNGSDFIQLTFLMGDQGAFIH